MVWGKFDRKTDESHHLVHHSADVAAVFRHLLDHPLFLRAIENAAGQRLDATQKTRLAAIAFLHDIGKIAPGFQARGWSQDRWPHKTTNHILGAFQWMGKAGDRIETALDGALREMPGWVGGTHNLTEWFRIAFSHHGRPAGDQQGPDGFRPCQSYDWSEAEKLMGHALKQWFPQAFGEAAPLPDCPAFQHFFAGLLALADWVGSDRRGFPFSAKYQPDYWQLAQKRAEIRLRNIGLRPPERSISNNGFGAILPGKTPSDTQKAVANAKVDTPLLILEAETGSGKTEAALWRYIKLRAAGKVDGLYFAVPTRAAATQLFSRVNDALKTMFTDPPEAVLAVPGLIAAGAAKGKRQLDWSVLWDDDTGCDQPTRWAAEHATRYLAAEVSVGTVDQAMLAALMVKHAHMRGTALCRSLLVIDEVHASDAYMRHVQTALLRQHLALGGHAMLMSATLGAVARAEWLGHALPDRPAAATTAYPAVWLAGQTTPVAPNAAGTGKNVSVTQFSDWSAQTAALAAIDAASRGARVLVIRNTVATAIETWRAATAQMPELVLQVGQGPALHHSRFAAEDRQLLDKAVEDVLGKDARRNGLGVIVIGTQTLEQSLDIDADFLITDLCPMDVLLQRIGRLHRHGHRRPIGFEQAQVRVLVPPEGLEPLLQHAENGLGAFSGNGSLSGVYVDVPILAATLEQIKAHPLWKIPRMNRALVEAATHPEALDALVAARGPAWEKFRRDVTGKTLAEKGIASRVILNRDERLPDRFPDDEKIKTRIGEEGVVVAIDNKPHSPFGETITRIALPPQWSHGLSGQEQACSDERDGTLYLTIADRQFFYDRAGLQKPHPWFGWSKRFTQPVL